MAILPLGPRSKVVDESFELAFKATDKFTVKVIYPSQLLDKINQSKEISSAVLSSVGKENFNNLRLILGEKAFSKFEDEFTPATLVLVPVTFYISESLGRTLGNFSFCLYQLPSGNLIYYNSFNYNVSIKGEPALALLSSIAIDRVSEELGENVFSRSK